MGGSTLDVAAGAKVTLDVAGVCDSGLHGGEATFIVARGKGGGATVG